MLQILHFFPFYKLFNYWSPAWKQVTMDTETRQLETTYEPPPQFIAWFLYFQYPEILDALGHNLAPAQEQGKYDFLDFLNLSLAWASKWKVSMLQRLSSSISPGKFTVTWAGAAESWPQPSMAPGCLQTGQAGPQLPACPLPCPPISSCASLPPTPVESLGTNPIFHLISTKFIFISRLAHMEASGQWCWGITARHKRPGAWGRPSPAKQPSGLRSQRSSPGARHPSVRL